MDEAGTTGLNLSHIPNQLVFDFSSSFLVTVGSFGNGYTGSNLNKFFYYKIKIQNGFLPSQASLIAPLSIEVRHECYTAVMTATGKDQYVMYKVYTQDVTI
jgi:hypothetical protein